jgi:uncharacterized protein YndB with AHSA1/START domain
VEAPAGHGRGPGREAYADPRPGRSGVRALPAAIVTSATCAALQGRDEVVVDAPPDILWRLIADSTEFPTWGPPVTHVEILNPNGGTEAHGATRKVHARFGRKAGHFVEHRVEHVPGRRVAYLIDEDTFGLSRVMTRPGFALELDPMPSGRTRVEFSFFHDRRGVTGYLLNPVIKLRQRHNRREALGSLKGRAEEIAGS